MKEGARKLGIVQDWTRQVDERLVSKEPNLVVVQKEGQGSVPNTVKACEGWLVQVVALLYYLLSYFPGGADSVRFFLRLFYSAFLQCLGVVQRAILR